MARTKFTPKPKRIVKPIYSNWGGHMIDPPKDCVGRLKAEDGGIWVDISYCYCCCEKHCDRYLSYTKMTKEEQREDQAQRGIKPITGGWDK